MEQAELAKINALTRREFTEEELYTFPVTLCHNDIDRDFERFTDESLEQMAELFIGKTIIKDHNPNADNQAARIYDTEVVTDAEKLTQDGRPFRYLKGYAYMVRTSENADFILEIDAGIKKEVSVTNVSQLSALNIYSTIVDVRTAMSKANIPDDGRRYLLVTPETMALLLNCSEFIKASSLGDAVVQTGAIGKVAGFLVKEWNDRTANLAMIAGHPKFATRASEWAVGVHVQDLAQSGKYIGACAVQGRRVYGHKVLRSAAIRAVYAPGSLTVSLTAGSTAGKTVATISAGNTGTTYAYKLNPSVRAAYNETTSAYGGTSLTSGTTEISVSEGDVLEIVNLSSGKVVAAAYVTVRASEIAS